MVVFTLDLYKSHDYLMVLVNATLTLWPLVVHLLNMISSHMPNVCRTHRQYANLQLSLRNLLHVAFEYSFFLPLNWGSNSKQRSKIAWELSRLPFSHRFEIIFWYLLVLVAQWEFKQKNKNTKDEKDNNSFAPPLLGVSAWIRINDNVYVIDQ